VYVLLGSEKADKPVRFFIARNCDVAEHAHYPPDWPKNGFVKLNAIEKHEDKWSLLNDL